MSSSALRPCAPASASVPKTTFSPGILIAAADEIVVERQDPLHRRKALLGVAWRAEKALLVSEIILDHESSLRIEICAALGHQLQVVVGRHRGVFDLSAEPASVAARTASL